MSQATHDHFKAIYSQDTPRDGAHGWVQWKGTNVCMDLHCVCGHHGHIDADFFYFWQCPVCGAKYAVGQVVKMIPLTPEQVAELEKDDDPFQTGDLPDADEEGPR